MLTRMLHAHAAACPRTVHRRDFADITHHLTPSLQSHVDKVQTGCLRQMSSGSPALWL